ncbi:MAG: acyl carrier protein [Acidimicrobiaceae bacterium]|nr:acyl carrier protein [Acidimicrobiaceae bacterium]
MTNAEGAQPLDRAAVTDLVVRELAQILETEPASIEEDVPFVDLGADSLALIELVEAIEEDLSRAVGSFHIDDDDLEDLVSVRDAVDYVVAKLQLG